MGDELTRLIEIFHKIEEAGGQATLTVTTQGGKTKTNVCIMCMYCILSGPHTDLHNGSGNF